jgi:hypothetical protein
LLFIFSFTTIVATIEKWFTGFWDYSFSAVW